MPEQPFSVHSLAEYARARDSRFANEPDADIVQYLYTQIPGFKESLPNTAQQSGQEIDRMKGQESQYSWGSALKNFFSQGLETINPFKTPVGLSDEFVNAALKDPNKAMDLAYQHTLSQAGSPVTSAVAAAQSKTPGEFGTNMMNVMTSTIPAAIGATMLGRGVASKVGGLADIAKNPATAKILGSYAERNIPGYKALKDLKPALDEIQQARKPKPLPGPYEPGYKDPSPMTTRTPVEPYREPPPRETGTRTPVDPYIEPKPGETGTRVPVAPFTWEETKQGPPPPLIQPSGTPVVTSGEGAPSHLNPDYMREQAAATAVVDPKKALPPSLIYQNVKTGIPQEVHDLLGQGKLNNIARDAEQIRMESGESALDKVDSQVGGTANRQRLLSTAEGQNTIMNLVNAMKRKNIKDILFYSNALDGLRGRVIK